MVFLTRALFNDFRVMDFGVPLYLILQPFMYRHLHHSDLETTLNCVYEAS